MTIQAAATLAEVHPYPQCADTAAQALHDSRFALAQAELEPNLIAHRALAAFVPVFAQIMQAIKQMLLSDLLAGPIAVRCAGQFPMRLLGEPSLGRAAFVDFSPVHVGRVLADRPIHLPSELHRLVATATPIPIPIPIGSILNLELMEAVIRGLSFANSVVHYTAPEAA